MGKKSHSKSRSHSKSSQSSQSGHGSKKTSSKSSENSVKSVGSQDTNLRYIAEDFQRMHYFQQRTQTSTASQAKHRKPRFTTKAGGGGGGAAGGSVGGGASMDYPPLSFDPSPTFMKNNGVVPVGTIFDMVPGTPNPMLDEFKTSYPPLVTVTPTMPVKGQTGGVGIPLPNKYTPTDESIKVSQPGRRPLRGKAAEREALLEHSRKLLSPGPDLLERAQRAQTTRNGKPVNSNTIPHYPSRQGLLSKGNESKRGKEIKTLLAEPYNVLSLITPLLGLTGWGGLYEENLSESIKKPIGLVVNVTFELPLLDAKSIKSFRVPVDDVVEEIISIFFDQVCERIEEVRQKGHFTIVHCMAGVSRSASFVMAYLMKHEKKSLRDAYRHVVSVRPPVCPNHKFLEQLAEYEATIHPHDHCKLVAHTENGITIKLPDFVLEEFWENYEIDFNEKYNKLRGR